MGAILPQLEEAVTARMAHREKHCTSRGPCPDPKSRARVLLHAHRSISLLFCTLRGPSCHTEMLLHVEPLLCPSDALDTQGL